MINWNAPEFDRQEVSALLDRTIHPGFWGEVSLQIQAGKIITVKTTETFKPHPEKNTLDHADRNNR